MENMYEALEGWHFSSVGDKHENCIRGAPNLYSGVAFVGDRKALNKIKSRSPHRKIICLLSLGGVNHERVYGPLLSASGILRGSYGCDCCEMTPVPGFP